MTDLKQLARDVILKNWPIGDNAFNSIWQRLENTTLEANPPSHGTAQPAFGSASGKTEPVVIAVAVFMRVLEDLVENTTLEELLPHLERISAILGHKGVGQRIRTTCTQNYPRETTVTMPPAFAYVYSHRTPNGEPVTQRKASAHLKERAAYGVFIYHEAELPTDCTGKVFFHREREPYAQEFSSQLPAIQYRILLQLLKYRERDTERSLAALVSTCWNETHRAKQILSQEASLAKNMPSKYRTMFTRLRRDLQAALGITMRTEKRSIYALIPWPESYCVVEEQRRAPTTI